MKKGYDDYANRRNIPHLNLYTKLIGMLDVYKRQEQE